VLDDLKLIHKQDTQDMLGVAEKQCQQLLESLVVDGADADGRLFAADYITNIICLGVGGSALAVDLFKSYPGVPMPVEVCRSYKLPEYVNAQTLVVAVSYSGDTEEVLLALDQAKERGARTVAITSGGRLAERVHDASSPVVMLPAGLQARYAVWLTYKALLVVLGAVLKQPQMLVSPQDTESAAAWLKGEAQAWLPTTHTAQNRAKQIALEVVGKSAVIYAGPLLAPAAYRWKTSLNENAKHVAWWGQYPEFSYNELLGWTKQPVSKPYSVIDIRSNLEHPRVQRYFEVSEHLLSGVRPAPLVVQPEGDTILRQLLYSCVLGDFVSIYVALLSGVNPTPIDVVERLRKEVI
jgi:glucose/mannose-6-phosphate isomerase